MLERALNIDDPAAESWIIKKVLPDHLCSECKPAAGDKALVKI